MPTSGTGAWSGYSTASSVHVNAAQLGGTITTDVALAFSGASVNSQGQSTGITNEMNLGVQPADGSRESYGRGTGVEVGLLENAPNNPNSNLLNLGARAEAGATPLSPASNPAPAVPGVQTGLVTKELLATQLNPLAYAGVLRGQALATWHEGFLMPMLGSPLGFGLGYADQVQLLNTGAVPGIGVPLTAPLVALDSAQAGPDRTTSQSFSLTYLTNNGDGTCGLASESHLTIAPIRLNLPIPDSDPSNDITIELLGEFVLKASATGKPGGGKLEYAPFGSATPTTPVLRIIDAGGVRTELTTQDLLGNAGLVLPASLAPLISLAVGEDPRAIAAPGANPDPNSQPTVTDTVVSGAADVGRLGLLSNLIPGINLLDLRLGHFESKVTVPAGGMNCEIPVSKTASPNPASAGDDITFTISVPPAGDTLAPFPCELTDIKVTDTVSVESGNPRFTLVSGTGPNGEVGSISGNTITFANIGNYRPGNTPLIVKVVIRIASNSPAGRIRDTVKVDASASNCQGSGGVIGGVIGGVVGQILGQNNLFRGAGGSLTGTGILSGPDIGGPAILPRTGAATDTRLPLALGLAGLAGALAIRRSRRARTA